MLPKVGSSAVGIGCAMAPERRVWANEISVFSYVEISALLKYGNGEFARTIISLRNALRTALSVVICGSYHVYRCQACEALIHK